MTRIFVVFLIFTLLSGCASTAVTFAHDRSMDSKSSIIVQGEGCGSRQLIPALEGRLAISGFSVVSSSKGGAKFELVDESKSAGMVGELDGSRNTIEDAYATERRVSSGVIMQLPADFVIEFKSACNGYQDVIELYGTIREQASGSVIGNIEHWGPMKPNELARRIVERINMKAAY